MIYKVRQNHTNKYRENVSNQKIKEIRNLTPSDFFPQLKWNFRIDIGRHIQTLNMSCEPVDVPLIHHEYQNAKIYE